MTDPHHPLFGQRLTVVSLSCSRGPQFISVALPSGGERPIRRAATDLERPVQNPVLAPRVSASRLLVLARYVQSMMASANKENVDAVETCSIERTGKAASCDQGPIEAATLSKAVAGTPARGAIATGPADGAPGAANARGEAPC